MKLLWCDENWWVYKLGNHRVRIFVNGAAQESRWVDAGLYLWTERGWQQVWNRSHSAEPEEVVDRSAYHDELLGYALAFIDE